MDQVLRWPNIIGSSLDDWLVAAAYAMRSGPPRGRDRVSFAVSPAHDRRRKDPSAWWPITAAVVTMIGGVAGAFLVLAP